MRVFIRFLLRHSLAVVAVSIALTAPSLYWTKRLYENLRPDLEELLPKQSRSIQDLGEIRDRMRSIQNLGLLIFTDDPAAGKRLSIDLAERISKLPPTTSAGVEYRIDKELAFFDKRKALFVDPADLIRIRAFVADRIEYEKELYNPLNIFSGQDIPEPKLDFPALLNSYAAKSASFTRFPDGFYATPDGKIRAILVYLPANNSGMSGFFGLKKAVKEIVDSMDLKSYSPSIRVVYTGDVQNTIEEYDALVQDIARSAEIVFALVTLALAVYFRSAFAVGCLFVALFMARFWTFAAAWFLVGYLNANSAFMGSLLLGSGITFGVILLARYLEERRQGRVPVRAAWLAIERTARATSTAALAAGVAYGSLFLTRFEGFRQYGIIGLMGMILCWVSSIFVLPSLLIQVERIRPFVKPRSRKRRAWLFEPLSRFIGRHPRAVVVGFGALTLASLASFARFHPDRIIETNLENLRNRESMQHGSGYYCHYLDQIFQRFLTPVAILTHSQDEAERAARSLRALQRDPSSDGSKLIMSVNTIRQFIPDEQPRKIMILRDIERLLPQRLLQKLPPAEQKQVHTFLTPQAFKPFGQKDLPKLVLDKFKEKDGSIGKLVLVEPPLSSPSWSGKELNEFVRMVRDAGDEVSGPGKRAPVAGGLPVVSDMIEAIIQDGPRATVFAFLAVVALIVIFFRKPRIVALMLFSLILGTVWLFGFILGAGFKINFLNFIAFPITFGIGIDYGVNIFHRYLRDSERDILSVVRETGGAVALCSLTTIIGYSSLVIARNQAFVSFGIMAIAGEITMLLAAVVALPAVLILYREGS